MEDETADSVIALVTQQLKSQTRTSPSTDDADHERRNELYDRGITPFPFARPTSSHDGDARKPLGPLCTSHVPADQISPPPTPSTVRITFPPPAVSDGQGSTLGCRSPNPYPYP